MSKIRSSPARFLSRIFRWLFPGPLGDGACQDLEQEHLKRRAAQGRVLAWLWYAGHLLVPSSWVLVYKLRQREQALRTGNVAGSASSKGRAWIGGRGAWLDVKLGFRMLVRYPGLTLVAGLAIAFAIAVGAGVFEYATQMVHPTLPLDEGHRIVGIRNWDAAAGQVEEQAMHNFAVWREQLESVEELGAFQTYERNLISGEGRAEPVEVAEISPSAFRLARVPPLLGRWLVEADEGVGAPPVVVIGYDLWQKRFEGDPDAVGRTVRLGSTLRTLVGVMPEDFAFPIAHSLWVPLRLNVLDYQRRRGPAIRVFGRLAPGVTLDEAQAELTSIGLRAAADFPDSHKHLRPEVMPYAQSITNLSWGLLSGAMWINAFFVMLLVLISGNVALLMFARAATRQNELVLRNALGAGRGRIMTQLFVEALVLAGVAAVAGLVAARFALRLWLSVEEADAGRPFPFWFHDSLSPATVLYAVVLTVLAAAIAGIVPALQVTGRRMEARLRQAAPGAGGLRFGGLWTWVIIVQVAVTVAFPSTAFFARRYVDLTRSLEVAFPAQEYLSVRIEMDREPPPGAPADTSRAEFLARFRTAYQELEGRLADESGVVGVTFANRLPRTLHRQRWIELEGGGATATDSPFGHRVAAASVDVEFFDVLNTPILSGRGFHSADLGSEGGVIVNQSFIQQVLGDRNAIGRRVRYAATAGEEPGPWHEIVGVVGDLGMIVLDGDPRDDPGLYRPAALGDAFPVNMVLHVRGDPESFAPRLRNLAAALDPDLRLHQLLPLDEVGASLWTDTVFLTKLLVLISSIALLLSLAVIYSVMSFTVTRRTREIGVRVALGAGRLRVVAAIFRRPLAQVGLGVVVGGGLVAALVQVIIGVVSAREAGLIAAYATLMMGVCMLACIVPTRRALRVEPTEALRADQ